MDMSRGILGGLPALPPISSFSISSHPINDDRAWLVEKQSAMPVNPSELRPSSQQHLERRRTEDFTRRYNELHSNIRYRHPDPGPPRMHEGRVGGVWRHVKEVLGYEGNQICFVDGLVRVYDTDGVLEPGVAPQLTRQSSQGPVAFSAILPPIRRSISTEAIDKYLMGEQKR